MKKKSVVCVIPSRSQGDYINNLNFLNVGNQMLLEFTIKSAKKSKIFDKIFVVFDNKKHKDFFESKYNIQGVINNKKNIDFTKLIKKYRKNILKNFSYICVLFPNSPFKNFQTIQDMFSKLLRKNLSFLISACSEKKKIYYKKNEILNKISNKKNDKLFYYVSGGINFFKTDFKYFDNYLEEINFKNIYKFNDHEGFSIYSIYDLILAGTINDIDPSIFNNLLKKN